MSAASSSKQTNGRQWSIRPLSTVPHLPHDLPAIGGIETFSSVDWPGMLTAVVFIGGCPWRCHYCHNPELQQRRAQLDWQAVCEFLQRRRGLLDGVVFSGGEPLSEPKLASMIATIRAMGYRVALHTAGIYPTRLAAVLPQLDWVGFDVKTHAAEHSTLTGRANSHVPSQVSLEILLDSRRPFECRTTWSPHWLSEADLLQLAEDLAERGVRHYAVQNYRDAQQSSHAHLSRTTLQALDRMFEGFSYR